MIRRRIPSSRPLRRAPRATLAGAGAALGAALLLSSCGSLTRSDAVAEVAGRTLTRSELAVLATDPVSGEVSTDAPILRSVITDWVVVSVVLQRDIATTSGADLQEALAEAKQLVVDEHSDESADLHDKGFDGAEFLCLAAFPIDATDDADAILAEFDDGMTFAEATTKYSRDPSFVSTGGVVRNESGQNCLDTNTFAQTYSAIGLVEEMVAADATPGQPIAVTLSGQNGDQRFIVELRSFDELTVDEQVQVSHTAIQEALDTAFSGVTVEIADRFGVWDSTRQAVVEANAG